MPTRQKLEQAIKALPLGEREALLSSIEQSISEEYDRLAAASIADDMRMIERHLAKHPFANEQMHEPQARVEAADHGEAENQPWEHVRQEILAKLRHSE